MKFGLAVKHLETCKAKNKHNNFTDGYFMAAAIFSVTWFDFQYHMTCHAVLLISERNVHGPNIRIRNQILLFWTFFLNKVNKICFIFAHAIKVRPSIISSPTYQWPIIGHCTHSLPHSQNPSLPPSQNPSLPPSLTHSLTHSLVHSLPPSLPPSIPHSLTHSLTHSLNRRLT